MIGPVRRRKDVESERKYLVPSVLKDGVSRPPSTLLIGAFFVTETHRLSPESHSEQIITTTAVKSDVFIHVRVRGESCKGNDVRKDVKQMSLGVLGRACQETHR